MYAIVRLENGIYYTSMVFGYFCTITAEDEYEKYLQSNHNRYYLVLNKEKTALVKQYIFTSKSEYLDPSVIIVDGGQDDWVIDDKKEIVEFLAGFPQESIEYDIPDTELNRCIQMDAAYKYEEYPTISTSKDIDNLMWTSGYFDDAYIKKCEEQPDGTLYVLMKDIWGCSIELWFSGDVTYSIKSRDREGISPYWVGSTVIVKDGFIYFVDEYDMTIEDISDEYCWFKSRNMKYHIIPNERFVWEKKQ